MQVIEKVKVVPEGYNGAGMDEYHIVKEIAVVLVVMIDEMMTKCMIE